MITKEQFIDLISEHLKWNGRMEEIARVLNSFIWESDWVEYTSLLFDKTLKLSFNEDGIDDIDWWIYEKNGRPEMKMWDSNNKEIPTETIEDLWEIVKDSRI